MQSLKSLVPFRTNLSQPEYIPTRLMQFFHILASKFPNHKLVSSDFHKLGEAVEGINAPVVQTRYKRRMIPVSTPLVSLFYFLHLQYYILTSTRSTKATSTSSSPPTSRSWSPCTRPSQASLRARTRTRSSWRAGLISPRRARRTGTIRWSPGTRTRAS